MSHPIHLYPQAEGGACLAQPFPAETVRDGALG
jgi:hypothetical protein